MANTKDQNRGAEKRAVKRRHLIYYLRVFDRRTDQILGHLVDITPEGAKLISESPIPTAERYQLRMMLPAEIFGRDHLDFEAESLWSNQDINPDFYDTGFRLHRIEARDALVIAHLIDEYGFRD